MVAQNVSPGSMIGQKRYAVSGMRIPGLVPNSVRSSRSIARQEAARTARLTIEARVQS